MPGIFIADSGGNLQGRGYDWGSGGGGGGGGGGGSATIFGYNWNNSDTTYQTIAGRKARFNNRVPCVRVYGPKSVPSQWSVSTNVAQEKRVAFSFKESDSAGLAAGSYNSRMTAWLEAIPANWTVFWTFHHEPNNSSGLEVPASDFVGAYRQMRAALDAATLNSGVNVYITVNFMAQYLASSQGWTDSWVPRKSDGVDILSWDCYFNPGFNTSSSKPNTYGPSAAQGGAGALGIGYNTTYPLPSERLAQMFQITERCGFADSWGLLEVNGPLRNWDNDEQARAACQQDYIDLCLAPPMTGKVPPKVMLLWEAPSGANWNQGYGYNLDTTRTPNGTNNAYPTRSDSPMWDVWYPYITGTPVGG